MPSRHILSEKSPEEAAEIVSKVDKKSYLAHTIRELQRVIFAVRGRYYHINTYLKPVARETGIAFFENGCDISLAYECESEDERRVRLVLAHELGHLVQQIDKLDELRGRGVFSEDEEVFAWEFAYHLVLLKGKFHQEDAERQRYIVTPHELETFLRPILRSKATEQVGVRVLKALGMPAS